MNLEYKSAGSGVLEADDETGVVEAIVSVTGVVDHDGDIIEPGAYVETLRKRKPKGIFAHDWKKWVSRTEAIEELLPGDPRLPKTAKDGRPWPPQAGALWVRTRYNLATTEGRDAYENVKFFGPDCEWSIGYRIPKGKATRGPDGVRRIKQVDLYEYSPVLFGANSLSGTLSLKTAGDGPGGVDEAAYEPVGGPAQPAEPGAEGGIPEPDVTDEEVAAAVAEIEDWLDDLDAVAGEPAEAKRKFTAEDRRRAAAEGHALPDGSYPIITVEDLRNAIQAYGRANPEDRARVRAHIIRRARALDRLDLIPDEWLDFDDDDEDDEEEKGSRASLDRSPRKNWVEMTGELPGYVREIARSIHQKRGMPLDRAIATAIAQVKRWCSGRGDVNADTRAKACAAVAEWEALKVRNRARMAARRAAKGEPDPGELKDTAPATEQGQGGEDAVESVVFPYLPGTYEELREVLREAAAKALADEGEGGYIEVVGTWPNIAVVAVYPPGGKAAAYEIAYRYADGELVLDDPVPVELKVSVDGDENEDIGNALPYPAMLDEVTAGLHAALAYGEAKAGRVLSRVNERRLMDAVGALLDVLRAAGLDVESLLSGNEDNEGGTDGVPEEPEQVPDSTAPSAQVAKGEKVVLDPDLVSRAYRLFADLP